MSERLKEPVLKTGDAQASVGSNPTLSANLISICGSTQEAEGAPLLREYGVKSSIEGSNPSVSSSSGEIARKAPHPDDFR